MKDKVDALYTRRLGKQKIKATRQAAQAIVANLPVWSGATQDSVLIGEGYPVSARYVKYPRRKYMAMGGTVPTSQVPVGQGLEDRANPEKILSQVSKLRPNLEPVFIAANSPATDAGVWEGRAPTPATARNSKDTLNIIMRAAARGTIFKRG